MTDETETPAFGIEDAKQLIERMKTAKARCFDKCFTRSYQAVEGAWEHTHGGFGSEEFVDIQAVYAWAKALGFEQNPDGNGFLHRCPECASQRMFPFADRLDPDQVLQFVLTDPRCGESFLLDILQDTLRTPAPAPAATDLPSPAAAFSPLEAS